MWSTFALIRVGNGRVTAVRPRPETAPLFAAALTAQQRSRPGSKPGLHGLLGDVAIEGIEDLLELLSTGAA